MALDLLALLRIEAAPLGPQVEGFIFGQEGDLFPVDPQYPGKAAWVIRSMMSRDPRQSGPAR
jgi:hypothetical protein